MKLTLNQDLFSRLEPNPLAAAGSLDYQNQLQILADGNATGPVHVLQLSSTLIRLSQDFYDLRTNATVSFEMRLSGSGLAPVSSASALLNAIQSGLATGAFSHITFLAAGTKVFDLAFAASGYSITSGAQVLTVSGALPTNFDQLYTLAGLIERVNSVDLMTAGERTAFFNEMSAFGITGLTYADGGKTLFDLHVTASQLSLSIGTITVTLPGTLPTDFGGMLSAAWDLAHLSSPDNALATLTYFGVDSLHMTIGGKTVLDVTGMTDGAAPSFMLGGLKYGEMQMNAPSWLDGGASYDPATGKFHLNADAVLNGTRGLVNSILAGEDGNDLLNGYAGRDALFGGSGMDTLNGGDGNDLLNGGNGRDTASFAGSAAIHVDLRIATAQDSGQGMDKLVGIENLKSDAGNDLLIGNDVANALDAGSGQDTLRGWGGADTLRGGAGNDILVGGAGHDTFVFGNVPVNATAIGLDHIRDFSVAEDVLRFDHVRASAWSSMTAATFVSTYAKVVGNDVVFDFGAGNKIILDGVHTLTGLAADIIL